MLGGYSLVPITRQGSLFGTVLLLDPVRFRKYEVCHLIGSTLNFGAEARLGAPLIKTT